MVIKQKINTFQCSIVFGNFLCRKTVDYQKTGHLKFVGTTVRNPQK